MKKILLSAICCKLIICSKYYPFKGYQSWCKSLHSGSFYGIQRETLFLCCISRQRNRNLVHRWDGSGNTSTGR